MTDDTSPSPRRKLPFRAWLWEKPAAAESGGRRRLRIFCRIVAIFLREFERDAIPLRASALTFTIILSMVPMLALSTAVLKGFGAGGQMRKAAHNLINTMEPRQPAAATVPGVVSPGQPPVVTPTENGPPPRPATLTIHLKTAVDTVFNSVERTNLTTLGMFGLAALFITVISVLSTIEDAMNVVWQAESGRALGRKIMDFLALMLLLPLAVNIGVAAMAALNSEAALAILEHIFPVEWAGPLLVRLLSSSFLVMTLVLLYRFLPNTRVPLFPAL
ncbi:MAG: YihY/virulence factor BrkB family protein, partial [Desulfobulbaceae bacterium]|nr:YihY/virulence factor BrkB family protein [Desulfobulbaceae bacterium]